MTGTIKGSIGSIQGFMLLTVKTLTLLFFLPVLALCLHSAWRGEMRGHELGTEDKRELAVAGLPDALVIDPG